MQFVIGAAGSAIVTMVASNVLGVSLIKIGAGISGVFGVGGIILALLANEDRDRSTRTLGVGFYAIITLAIIASFWGTVLGVNAIRYFVVPNITGFVEYLAS